MNIDAFLEDEGPGATGRTPGAGCSPARLGAFAWDASMKAVAWFGIGWSWG